jgi:hypothetical protein
MLCYSVVNSNSIAGAGSLLSSLICCWTELVQRSSPSRGAWNGNWVLLRVNAGSVATQPVLRLLGHVILTSPLWQSQACYVCIVGVVFYSFEVWTSPEDGPIRTETCSDDRTAVVWTDWIYILYLTCYRKKCNRLPLTVNVFCLVGNEKNHELSPSEQSLWKQTLKVK